MKKVLSLVLVVLMCLTFASCGSSADAEAVAAYVALNGDDILDGFEQGFSSSGMTCTSSIRAEDTGFIVDVNIDQLDNVDASTAAMMQQTYAAASSTFEGMLADMQKEVPGLTYFVFNICEVDGDVIATISAGK